MCKLVTGLLINKCQLFSGRYTSFIDLLVFIPLSFLDNYVCGTFENKLVILCWLTTMSFITLFYTIFLHYKYGQTFGKMVTNIKVVDLSESKDIRLRQAILRSITYIAIELSRLLHFTFLIFVSDNTMVDNIESIDNFGQIVALTVVLFEIIVLFSNNKRMALHDYIAKTVVVKLHFEEKT
jgi:uncharacterized RDD family membrane protein YckC